MNTQCDMNIVIFEQFWKPRLGRVINIGASLSMLQVYMTVCIPRADFQFFLRRDGKISNGVQAAPLSELFPGVRC